MTLHCLEEHERGVKQRMFKGEDNAGCLFQSSSHLVGSVFQFRPGPILRSLKSSRGMS